VPLKPNLLAIGCALALIVAIAVVLIVNFAPNPETAAPNLGLIALSWFAAFFFPPLFIGSRVQERGAVYGLVIGLVPLIVAILVGYGIPALLALVFYALAPIGGFLGQRLSVIRRAG
jgi:tryptophan-rich sensory protein